MAKYLIVFIFGKQIMNFKSNSPDRKNEEIFVLEAIKQNQIIENNFNSLLKLVR